MKFYNSFNEMFNAQSGLKKDMSVFNDLRSVGRRFFGDEIPEERNHGQFLSSLYSDLCYTFDCYGPGDDFGEYVYLDWYFDGFTTRKAQNIYNKFESEGKADEFKRLFPVLGRYSKYWDLTDIGNARGEIWPVYEVALETSANGKVDLWCGFRTCSGFGKFEDDIQVGGRYCDSSFDLGVPFNDAQFDSIVIDECKNIGLSENAKASLSVLQAEAERIDNFDIDAYFGGRQYDLTNPIKEKFMMPVD